MTTDGLTRGSLTVLMMIQVRRSCVRSCRRSSAPCRRRAASSCGCRTPCTATPSSESVPTALRKGAVGRSASDIALILRCMSSDMMWPRGLCLFRTETGIKTRPFEKIREELRAFFDVHDQVSQADYVSLYSNVVQ